MLISGSQLSIRETVSFNAVYYIILCSSSKALNSWTCKVNSFRKGQIKPIVQSYIWKFRRKQSELWLAVKVEENAFFLTRASQPVVSEMSGSKWTFQQLINLTRCSTVILYPATLTEWRPLASTGEPQQMSVCNVSQPAFENVPDEPSLTRTSSRWAARWSFCSLGSCRPRNTSTCIVPSSAWF